MNKLTSLPPAPSELLRKSFPFKPTLGQASFFVKMDDFFQKPSEDKPVFILKGYAGTGKTAKGYGAYENAASLDRIDPKKGYIDGNIMIVCWEANRSKALLTPDKFYMLARFYEKYELS